MTRYEVVIIGGGPRGLTAGLYRSLCFTIETLSSVQEGIWLILHHILCTQRGQDRVVHHRQRLVHRSFCSHRKPLHYKVLIW